MKRLLVTIAVVFLFFGTNTNAQLPALQQKAILLKRMIELKHYSPKPVDDSFSVAVFKSVIEDADPKKNFFYCT